MTIPDSIQPGEKTIDTRDVAARLRYLRSLVDDLECSACETPLTIEENEDGEPVLVGHDPNCESADTVTLDDFIGSDDYEEIEFLEEIESADIYGYEDGVTLIHDDHFQEYAEEEARSLYDADWDSWPFNLIDWEKAAEELQTDYSSIDVGNETYWYR